MDIISSVAKKLDQGIRLSDEDALALFQSNELVEIGRLADQVNRKKNRDLVFFNINRHINPTNICALSCKFCAYSRKPGEEGAYAYSIEEMVAKAGEAVAQGATEVHMVGGLHPRWKFEHYKDMIKAVKDAFPQVHVKAFTAVELDWLARRARKTIEEVLRELQEVGLGSLPGGGAEIFHPEIRDVICDTKVSAEQWLDTHRLAHRLGMHSNCTMLYGHIENYAHRVDHMRRLRELQDETRGFNAFIPLAFQPFQNEMGIDRYTFGYDDLKTLAIARLYLDNFRHIKSYWIMLGQEIAQLGLQFGANDLDGTVIEEKISRMAGGRSGMAMSRSFIEQLIHKSKRIPCERDTLYKPVRPPEVTALPEPLDSLRQTINKADYGDDLSADDFLLLATEASLHDLGRLANAKASAADNGLGGSIAPTATVRLPEFKSSDEVLAKLIESCEGCVKKFILEPKVIALDLASNIRDAHSWSLSELAELVTACRERFPRQEIALWGMKGLWRLANAASLKLDEAAQLLSKAGLQLFASSPAESETDLTHNEVAAVHEALHKAGIESEARVELSAPAFSSGEPQWASFLRRVEVFAQVQSRSKGLRGIAVSASPDSFVTTSEYLRAVALTRLAAINVAQVTAPLSQIPTISLQKGLGTSSHQHPAEKVAAVALHFGANDLGAIDVATLSPVAIMQQVRAAGFSPTLRTSEKEAISAEVSELISKSLRHAPSSLMS